MYGRALHALPLLLTTSEPKRGLDVLAYRQAADIRDAGGIERCLLPRDEARVFTGEARPRRVLHQDQASQHPDFWAARGRRRGFALCERLSGGEV